MAYVKHTFKNGDVLNAATMDEIDTQVQANDAAATAVNTRVTQLIASDDEAIAYINAEDSES